MVKFVCECFGLSLDPKKEQAPSDKLVLLGANVHIFQDSVEISLADKKKEELIADLARTLQLRKLTPAGAAKFRGRLGFAQSCLYGKFGRAHLAPFSKRQYSKISTGGNALDIDLFEVIPWWIRTLGEDGPRRVACNFRHPVLVYTDACGDGHIGAVVFVDGRTFTAHCHVPPWMNAFGIAELELVGTILGLAVCAEYAPGRNILLCCDNLGARGTLTRGHPKTTQGRGVASVFWSFAAGAKTHVWIEFVRSGLNTADDPSRACDVLGKDKCKIPMANIGIPISFYNLFESKETYNVARFGVKKIERGVRVGWNCPANV